MIEEQDRFTEETRRALGAASEHAISRGHLQVRPLHLLLGVLESSNDNWTKSIKDTSDPAIRNALHALQLMGSQSVSPQKEAEFSPAVKHYLEQAFDLVQFRKDSQITPKDLLLAIMSDEPTSRYFNELGFDCVKLYRAASDEPHASVDDLVSELQRDLDQATKYLTEVRYKLFQLTTGMRKNT